MVFFEKKLTALFQANFAGCCLTVWLIEPGVGVDDCFFFSQ